MTAKTALACFLVALVAAPACSGRERIPDAQPARPPAGGIAPQNPGPSPVGLSVTPKRLRFGKILVRTVARGDVASVLTADEVWLDRWVDGKWQTAWLLGDGISMSRERARKGVPLNPIGVSVPGSITLDATPPPPPGQYRLRLEVLKGKTESEHGLSITWATEMIEILPS